MATKPGKKSNSKGPSKAAQKKGGAAKKAAPKKATSAKGSASRGGAKKASSSSQGRSAKQTASSSRGSQQQSQAQARSEKVRVASRPKSTAGSYTQSEFLENVKAFCGLNKRSEAKELVEDLASLVKDTLKRGYKIPFFGLGKMYVRSTKQRIGRNPATGQEMTIPAKKRVRFAPAKALKEAVL